MFSFLTEKRTAVNLKPAIKTTLQIAELEDRVAPAPTLTLPFGDVNVTQVQQNQVEVAITVDPNNILNQIATATWVQQQPGFFAARSNDGGQTWLPVAGPDFIIGDGNDGFVTACCDNTVTWDTKGNVYIGWLAFNGNSIVTTSTDGGATLTQIGNLTSNDQPTITTGPSSNPGNDALWVVYNQGGQSVVQGLEVFGLGQFGTFTGALAVPNSPGNFGDIAVGPNGEVAVAWQNPSGGEGPATISVSVDTDGFGAGAFGNPVVISQTEVGGFDFIAPQPNRSVDAEVSLVYDRSGGQFNGRLYAVYADEAPPESDDHDIFLRFSDDNGQTWSARTRVNDDTTTNSQFLPQAEMDQSTGVLAITWYDARFDDGSGGVGDSDNVANTDVAFFGTATDDGGQTFSPNLQISTGFSNAVSGDGGDQFDFGDYSGLAAAGGSFFPIWADNSNSTGDNPDGQLSRFDTYVRQVSFLATPQIQVGAVLLAPDAATNILGSTHTVTATVLATDGSLVPNRDVFFTVAGANNVTGVVRTDANGQAQFTYTGVIAGVDQITATVDGDGDQTTVDPVVSPIVTKTWLPPASISGTVFVDNANPNDGLQSPVEQGIPGVTIQLTGTDVLGNVINLTTVTDQFGNYSFGGLGGGTYEITQIQPTAYIDGQAVLGQNAGGFAINSNQFTAVSLATGGVAVNFNFTEQGLAAGFVSKRGLFASTSTTVVSGTVNTPADLVSQQQLQGGAVIPPRATPIVLPAEAATLNFQPLSEGERAASMSGETVAEYKSQIVRPGNGATGSTMTHEATEHSGADLEDDAFAM
jgi:hypothetical protein